MDIVAVNGHTLVVRNAIQPIQLNSTCNFNARKITGTLLVSYRNCCITIDGIEYDDEKTKDNHDITLIPTIGVNFHAISVSNKPDLRQVNLLRIENRNHIDKLRRDHQIFQHTSTGVLSLLAVLMIGMTVKIMRSHAGSPVKVNSTDNVVPVPSSSFTDDTSKQTKIRDESSLGREQLTSDSPATRGDSHMVPTPQPRFMF